MDVVLRILADVALPYPVGQIDRRCISKEVASSQRVNRQRAMVHHPCHGQVKAIV